MNIKLILGNAGLSLLLHTNALALTNSVTAATIPTEATANAKAAEQFQVGSMFVERHGDHGAPIILIPGLGSGSWVWENTVRQLEKNHVLYVVTLAGFNGRPSMDGPKMDKAYASLLTLINERKLNKPILVGHSLGATLSIWFAQQHSDKIAGVFAVEGLPVFPGTENMPLDQRPAMAQAMKAQMTAMKPETFAAQQLQYMRYIGVIDDKLAQKIAALSSKSDPAATADYMGELMRMDIRKDMVAIKVPLVQISPYNAADLASRNIKEEDKRTWYQSLMQGAPQLQVVSINGARHFPMLDQPELFADALQNYLKSVEK
jgi:pimeloyl-ACP methyl ester carboxylesterase